jgi:hypothetical protein
MTNTLALLSSPLIQDDHTPTVNIDTNPVLWRV